MNDKMFIDNQKLIYFVINKMGIKYNFQECYDAGEIGLIKAMKTFDESKGFKFSSYAIKFVKNEICKYLQYSNRKRRKGDLKDTSLDIDIIQNVALLEIIDSGIDIENDCIEKEKIDLLNTIIEILEPNDNYMIKHYFGLGKYEKKDAKTNS